MICDGIKAGVEEVQRLLAAGQTLDDGAVFEAAQHGQNSSPIPRTTNPSTLTRLRSLSFPGSESPEILELLLESGGNPNAGEDGMSVAHCMATGDSELRNNEFC